MLKKNLRTILILVLLCSISLFIGSSTLRAKNQREKAVWQADIGSTIISPPVVSYPYLFVQTTKNIVALDFDTGDELWKTNWPRDPIVSINTANEVPLILEGNMLIAQRENSPVGVFSADTGELIWQQQSVPESSAYVINVHEGDIYIARYNSNLRSVNLANGVENWYATVPSRKIPQNIFHKDNLVYLFTGTSLSIFNQANGIEIIDKDRIQGVVGGQAEDKDVFYLAYIQGECSFTSLEISNLSENWCVSAKKASPLSRVNAVVVHGEVVYVSGSKLVALSKQTGEVLWSISGDTFSTPYFYQEKLYVQGKTQIFEIDQKTGKINKSIPLPEIFPVISWGLYRQVDIVGYEDYLFVSSGSNLYSFSLSQE